MCSVHETVVEQYPYDTLKKGWRIVTLVIKLLLQLFFKLYFYNFAVVIVCHTVVKNKQCVKEQWQHGRCKSEDTS